VLDLGDLGEMPARQGSELPSRDARVLPDVPQPATENLPGLLNLVRHFQAGLRRTCGAESAHATLKAHEAWRASAELSIITLPTHVPSPLK